MRRRKRRSSVFSGCDDGISLDQAWGSALLAGLLSFASPKESSQRKGDPGLRGRRCRLPCATRQAGRLRNSGLRPSDSPRRLPPAHLRCSALHTGTQKNSQAPPPYVSTRIVFPGPLERCRATQGLADKGRALSEGEARVAQPSPDPSSAGNPRRGHRPRGGLFFGYFLLATQKKVRPPARRNPKLISQQKNKTGDKTKCPSKPYKSN